MTLIAIIAMICGPIPASHIDQLSVDSFEQISVKQCYKDFLICIEHKQARTRISDEKALKECLLEK